MFSLFAYDPSFAENKKKEKKERQLHRDAGDTTRKGDKHLREGRGEEKGRHGGKHAATWNLDLEQST